MIALCSLVIGVMLSCKAYTVVHSGTLLHIAKKGCITIITAKSEKRLLLLLLLKVIDRVHIQKS